MNRDIRLVKTPADLIGYFSGKLGWNIDMDDFDDIEDITYDLIILITTLDGKYSLLYFIDQKMTQDFPGGASYKEPTCQ